MLDTHAVQNPPVHGRDDVEPRGRPAARAATGGAARAATTDPNAPPISRPLPREPSGQRQRCGRGRRGPS
eukprot:15131724-Alexandrium_andersonii.AAC.1